MKEEDALIPSPSLRELTPPHRGGTRQGDIIWKLNPDNMPNTCIYVYVCTCQDVKCFSRYQISPSTSAHVQNRQCTYTYIYIYIRIYTERYIHMFPWYIHAILYTCMYMVHVYKHVYTSMYELSNVYTCIYHVHTRIC
jgi:hypothetical protein